MGIEFQLNESGKTDKAWRMFFVDSENGAGALVEGFERLTKNDTIVVFHRASFPKKLRTRLELGPACVEWIQCVDPGVKNSMDVQIIAELAMRLAQDSFHEAYIISRDKGYMPAVHYMEMHPAGEHHSLKVVDNINQAVNVSMSRTLVQIEEFETREEIEHSLALMMGTMRSKKFITKMVSMFSSSDTESLRDIPKATIDVLSTPSDLGETISGMTRDGERDDERLTDLKGIGAALSRKMSEVGVATPAKLRTIGAVEMWRRIREQDPSFSIKWLYAFEAAITGSSLKGIGTERRIELKQAAKSAQRRA